MLLNLGSTGVINRVVAQLEANYQLRRIRIFQLRSVSRAGVLFAVLGRQTSVAAAIGLVQANPNVLWVQPNFVYRTSQGPKLDTYSNLQYGPQKIKADGAHNYSTGKGVVIAVVDTGLDFKHPDLKGKVIETANFVPGDKNFAQDVHGTLMAGIIGAVKNNGMGIYGVAPEAKIMAIKVCKPTSKESIEAIGSSDSLAQGLDFAILKKAQVINLSLGGPKEPLISALVEKAFALGIILVAAAGNDGPQGPPRYPAALDKVIGVSAIDIHDQLYGSANRGPYIDLVAPGVEILSTVPGGKFNVSTGTSMAASHVSGVVALILEKRQKMLPIEIKSLLEATARNLGAEGRDDLFGSGCVDASKLFEK